MAAAGQSHRARGQAGHSQGSATATAFSVPSAVTPAAGSRHGQGSKTLFFMKCSGLLRANRSKTQKNGLRTDNFS